MASETISRVRSSPQSSAVSWRSTSGERRAQPVISVVEREAKSEPDDSGDEEFSALDPEVGAILTQVSPGACREVAPTVKQVLRK